VQQLAWERATRDLDFGVVPKLYDKAVSVLVGMGCVVEGVVNRIGVSSMLCNLNTSYAREAHAVPVDFVVYPSRLQDSLDLDLSETGCVWKKGVPFVNCSGLINMKLVACVSTERLAEKARSDFADAERVMKECKTGWIGKAVTSRELLPERFQLMYKQCEERNAPTVTRERDVVTQERDVYARDRDVYALGFYVVSICLVVVLAHRPLRHWWHGRV